MKQLLVIMFLLCSANVVAQDVIVKKDGTTIVCRVLEFTSSEITYKKWSDLNGSNYVMNRADASTINYENGSKVDLSGATNLYVPNNQNDGVQQYNDKALMALDFRTREKSILKKIKTVKTIGLVGGIAMAGIGTCFCVCNEWDRWNWKYVFFGSAAAFTTGCLLYSNHLSNKVKHSVVSVSMIKHSFMVGKESSLITSVDFLKDDMCNRQLIGLGLRYNF